MQHVLREEQHISALLNSMMDLVRVVRPDGSVILQNRAMTDRFGYMVGKPCYQALGCTKECEECVRNHFRSGEKEYNEERTINGRSYSMKASPLFDADGTFQGAIEVFRDITEEVKLRDNLIKANAKMREDLSMARGLQRSMFRKTFPDRAGYRFSVGFYPCEDIGGDACDCIQLKDGRILFYVADVSGHGVRAAMLTVFLKQEISMLTKQETLKDIEHIFHEIYSGYMELNAGEWTYITLFMAIINPDTGEVACMNAGHSVAPLIKTRQDVREIYLPGSPICRWTQQPGGRQAHMTLHCGDRMLLFTDGVVDLAADNPFSYIKNEFAREPFCAQDFIQKMKKARRQTPSDDLLMLICERVR